jgi:uncharacterized membrane protein YbhN (UPF0104 family)
VTSTNNNNHDLEAQIHNGHGLEDGDVEVMASVPEHPDAESVDSDEDHDMPSKEEVVNPRQLLWILIVSLAVLIFLIFVILLCMLAVN